MSCILPHSFIWGSHHYHKISRTWTHCINATEKKWDQQLDALANAYLAWKHKASPVETTESEFMVQYVDIYGQYTTLI